MAINQHSCLLSQHSCHSRRCHSKQLKSFTKIARTYFHHKQRQHHIRLFSSSLTDSFTIQGCEACEVVRISKYACDPSRPMKVFCPEIGQRNLKNSASPAGPRFTCLTPVPFPIYVLYWYCAWIQAGISVLSRFWQTHWSSFWRDRLWLQRHSIDRSIDRWDGWLFVSESDALTLSIAATFTLILFTPSSFSTWAVIVKPSSLEYVPFSFAGFLIPRCCRRCAGYSYLNGLTQSTYTKWDKINKFKGPITASIAPRQTDILNLLVHVYRVKWQVFDLSKPFLQCSFINAPIKMCNISRGFCLWSACWTKHTGTCSTTNW